MANTDADERAELTTDLMRAVLKMSAHSHRAGSAMNRDAGLSNARWILIDQTAELDGPISISEHARRLGFSRQSLKRLAADMARDGLVTLEPDPSDRRALLVVLTDEGRRVQQEALVRGLNYNRRISRDLPMAELRTALDTVRALTERMMEMEGWSGRALASVDDVDGVTGKDDMGGSDRG